MYKLEEFLVCDLFTETNPTVQQIVEFGVRDFSALL